MHLPSRIRYHDAPSKAVERGNILVWEQPLADRLAGKPLSIEARFDTQSILYRTLWLFGVMIVVVVVLFAGLLFWIMRKGRAASAGGGRLTAGARGVSHMSPSVFSAKPSVLRCSRCGKFVDWAEARLQIVCGCRPHLDLPPVLTREATAADRDAALALFRRDFGRTSIASFGEVVPLEQTSTIVADMQGDISGALAWKPREDALQIVALATDPMWQRSGSGRATWWPKRRWWRGAAAPRGSCSRRPTTTCPRCTSTSAAATGSPRSCATPGATTPS